MAATLETNNPALVRVQEGIRTGYEAVGNAADAVGNWFAEGWNATVAEANHNLAIVREQGPSAPGARAAHGGRRRMECL